MQVVLIKFVIINFTFFNILLNVSGLVELTSVDDNIIKTTETATRDAINKLFQVLKLKEINNKPKFKQYSMVHNSLVAIMLQDNDNLKTIARVARVNNNIDNTTVNFMGVINELLDAEENGHNINESNDNVMDGYVIKYINGFLSELKVLKEKFGVVNNDMLDINDEIVKILTEDDDLHHNATTHNDSNISNDTESNDILSENEFWQPSGRRIYRGERTKIKYYPFMASIQIFHRFHCSGSIVKSDLIITAASCLQLAWNNRFYRENPAFLSVRVGSSFHNGGGEVIPVLEVYFHPNYNPKNLRHNLCILRLIRHLKLRKKVKRVKKIMYDTNPWAVPEMTDGVTVLGWGAKGANNIVQETLQGQLALAELDFYPLSECAEIYSREYVSRNNFCAGFFSKGGGACNRDVGGPGIIEGLLTGVISFGSPLCGTPNAPTVFTKLGYYVDWIEEIMEQPVPRKRKQTTLPPPYRPFTFTTESGPTTTFTMSPVAETLPTTTTTSTFDVETLRLLKDEQLFQEFLSTMFGSKEDSDIEDSETEEIIKPVPPKNKKAKIKQRITEGIDFATKLFGTTRTTKRNDVKRFTILEPNLSDIAENELERDIAKLIDGIDKKGTGYDEGLETPTGSESALDNEVTDDDNKKEYFDSNSESDLKPTENKVYTKPLIVEHKKRDNLKSANDSVLTLLYLSDNDKRNAKEQKNEQTDDEVGTGISIDADPFIDLTFRQDVQKALYNFLPKDELYKLLADVDSDNENKTL